MATGDDLIIELVRAFAATAIDPGQWHGAMVMLDDALGAVGSALELTDMRSGAVKLESTLQLGDELIREYQQRIFHRNPRIARGLEMGLGAIADDRQLMVPDDYCPSEFIDWLERSPHYYIIGARILAGNGKVGFLSANFSKKRGLATADDHRVFALLAPHLVNAVAASRAIGSNRLEQECITQTMLDGDKPFALLDANGIIVECSQGFDDVLRHHHLIDGRNGKLIATMAVHGGLMDRFLASALGPMRYLASPRPIRLSGPTAPRGLVLRAIPLSPGQGPFAMFAPVALITLTDLDRPRRVDTANLMAMFSLTPREAELAATIGQGQTLAQASASLKISVETARHHLKAIFSKLGISRQAELVAMIEQIMP